MMGTQKQQDSQSIVEHKVRRRVAKKVLRDIQHQLEDIEQQEKDENSAKKYILPVVLVLALVIILMTVWPLILRFLSTLFGAD